MRKRVSISLTLLCACLLVSGSPGFAAESLELPDIAVTTTGAIAAPGTSTTVSVDIVNHGAPTTTPVALTLVTPFYVNVDRSRPLPAGCAMRLENPDPIVPEVVTCQIAQVLRAGTPIHLEFPLAVTARARIAGPVYASVIVGLPDEREATTDDNERYVTLTLTKPTPEAPEGNEVDYWLTGGLQPGGPTRETSMAVRYGNVGKPSAEPGRTTIVTPFFVNAVFPLPDSCRYELQDANPLVPEIVTCELGKLPEAADDTLRLPVKVLPGARTGSLLGLCLIAPLSTVDVEQDQTDNRDSCGVQNIDKL
jgi:hypothetical protein